VLTDNCLPSDIAAADADGQKTVSAAGSHVGRRLIVTLLLTAAALDLTRCSLVLAAARHPAPAAGLAAAALAAAAMTARTARGCQAGRRWAGWAALLIGAMSAPQAAAAGFRAPYTIPDTATAVAGILLAITVLATTGRMDRRETTPKIPGSRPAEPRGDPERRNHAAPRLRTAARRDAKRMADPGGIGKNRGPG
jgi:hypothetical protein